jgi:hypothetical protein
VRGAAWAFSLDGLERSTLRRANPPFSGTG